MITAVTAEETARLIDWLKENGHSGQEVIECIKFIAAGIQQENRDK